jgi:hypothetical protein
MLCNVDPSLGPLHGVKLGFAGLGQFPVHCPYCPGRGSAYTINKNTHPTQFDSEDGDRIFFRNVCNTAHFKMAKKPKRKIYINDEPS